MDSRFIITFFLILLSSSIHGSNDWADFEANDIYPKYDVSQCVFPFTYQNKTYNNCTTDGDNSNRPWCSLFSEYNGGFTYCYDFWKTTLTCGIQAATKKPYSCTFIKPSSLYKQCQTNIKPYKLLNCMSEHIKKTGKPLVHTDDCPASYRSMTMFHSKCTGPSDFAIPIKMTADNKQAMLDTHNAYRAAVGSRYMFKLYWDDTLADMAKTHADMCAFDHDQANNRLTLNYRWKNGQNMVFATGYSTALSDLLTMMFDSEKARFVYGVGCDPAGSCLHYTQLMLSNMTRVGCAETHCLYPDRVERYLVCNYIHSQYSNNYMIPYIPSDTPAIDCPSKNVGGLCDCGDKTCQYDQNEYLHPDTCECRVDTSKRSFNENELTERDNADDSSEESTVYIPNGGNMEEEAVDKRMRQADRPQNPGKRNMRQADRPSQPGKRFMKKRSDHETEKRQMARDVDSMIN